MQVALISDSELGPTIKRLMHSHKHLCAMTVPLTGKVALYAGLTDADALIAARKDHPTGEIRAVIEYLSKEELAAMGAKPHLAPRPAADSVQMKHLGEVGRIILP